MSTPLGNSAAGFTFISLLHMTSRTSKDTSQISIISVHPMSTSQQMTRHWHHSGQTQVWITAADASSRCSSAEMLLCIPVPDLQVEDRRTSESQVYSLAFCCLTPRKGWHPRVACWKYCRNLHQILFGHVFVKYEEGARTKSPQHQQHRQPHHRGVDFIRPQLTIPPE
jgi:hypothetical protein